MAIKVRAATTPEELDAVFKLRHQVFVEQDARFSVRDDKRLVDRFDAFNTSVNFIAFVDDNLIGTLRVTIDSLVGIPADDYYNFHQHVDEDSLLVSEGQFCIQEKYRGNLAVLNSLMMMGFYWAVSKKATHLVAPLNPALQNLMQRCGYKKVADVVKTHGELSILPMICDLKCIRDSFVSFAEKQNIVFFIENFSRHYYRAGEVIIHQDDPGEAAYFIVEGEVSVQVGDVNRPEMLIDVQSLREGELFGEIALLCNSKRTANVIAKQDTQTMVLARHTFLEQTKKDPEKLQFLLDLLGRRLYQTTKRLSQGWAG